MVRRAADSLNGLSLGWQRERAVRVQVLLSTGGLIVLWAMGVALPWLAAFLMMALIGLVAELMNSAIETLLDRIHPAQHGEIGAAKDLSSAAAFVINVATAVAFLGALLLLTDVGTALLQ